MKSTLFDKIWQSHVIAETPEGDTLLYVDRHLLHEGSRTPIEKLDDMGLGVARPRQSFGTADHYVPTAGGLDQLDPDRRKMIETFDINMGRFGIEAWGLGTSRQGIVHVIGPELGLTLPGTTLVCGDSHTSTHGALGALAFGIGASEVAHVLATQTIWQRKPKAMRVSVDHAAPHGVFAKDVILSIIAEIGISGANGHVIEYAGDTITSMSIEERLTICNMSIEAGARAGLIAPDETTFTYLRGRPFAPRARCSTRLFPTGADCVPTKARSSTRRRIWMPDRSGQWSPGGPTRAWRFRSVTGFHGFRRQLRASSGINGSRRSTIWVCRKEWR